MFGKSFMDKIKEAQKEHERSYVIYFNDGTAVKEEYHCRESINDEMVYAVIRIPKESKKKIRDQFELLGMTDSFIFPDDIAKVFNGIKDKLAREWTLTTE